MLKWFNIEVKRETRGWSHGWVRNYSVTDEPLFQVNLNAFGSNSRPCCIFEDNIVVVDNGMVYSLYKLNNNELRYIGKERRCKSYQQAYDRYKSFTEQVDVMCWGGKDEENNN